MLEMFWYIKIKCLKKKSFCVYVDSNLWSALTDMRAKLSFTIAILLRQYMMELLNCHLLSFALILDSLHRRTFMKKGWERKCSSFPLRHYLLALMLLSPTKNPLSFHCAVVPRIPFAGSVVHLLFGRSRFTSSNKTSQSSTTTSVIFFSEFS